MISWQTDRQTDSYDTVGLQFWLMYVFYHWTFFHKVQTGSSVSKSTQIKLSSHSGFAPLFFSRLVFALDETDPILRSSSHLQSSNWLSCCCNQQNSRHQPPHQTFLNHNIFFLKIGVVSSKVCNKTRKFHHGFNPAAVGRRIQELFSSSCSGRTLT